MLKYSIHFQVLSAVSNSHHGTTLINVVNVCRSLILGRFSHSTVIIATGVEKIPLLISEHQVVVTQLCLVSQKWHY